MAEWRTMPHEPNRHVKATEWIDAPENVVRHHGRRMARVLIQFHNPAPIDIQRIWCEEGALNIAFTIKHANPQVLATPLDADHEWIAHATIRHFFDATGEPGSGLMLSING